MLDPRSFILMKQMRLVGCKKMMRVPSTEQPFEFLNRSGKGDKARDILIGEQCVFLSIILSQKFSNEFGTGFALELRTKVTE